MGEGGRGRVPLGRKFTGEKLESLISFWRFEDLTASENGRLPSKRPNPSGAF